MPRRLPRLVLLASVVAPVACGSGSLGPVDRSWDNPDQRPASRSPPGNDDPASETPAPPDPTVPASDGAGAPTPDDPSPGALGMGLAGLADWSTAYPFIDFMRSARAWKDWKNPANEAPFDEDEDGWIRSVQPGHVPGTVWLVTEPGDPLLYPRFVVTWEGTGRLSYSSAARRVDAQSGARRDVLEVSPGAAILHVEASDPADPIRNISIVPEALLAAHEAGEVFNPDWLRLVRPFRALRFMDWMRTNFSDQSEWAQRPRVSHRSFVARPGGDGTQGVPLEVMIDLANRLRADPWFNIPHRADLNYVREFAKLVRQRLDPELTAFVEHSNEVWNWGFSQAQYANEAGQERWGPDAHAPFMQWHGMRTAQVCDVFKREVFTDDPERVHCALGVQADWFGLEDAALSCPLWVAEGNSPCHQHGIDSVAITGYFTGCLHEEEHLSTIRRWMTEPDGGMQKGIEQARDGRHFECRSTVEGLQARYAHFARVGQRYGLQVTAYEGGQHISGNGHSTQDDPDFTAFYVGLNREPAMRDLYRVNLENWQAAGGALFVHFVEISRPGRFGSWGALEHLGQSTSPKWEALLEFNDRACWWDGCGY